MINDTLGHAVGDGLLIEVAKRLQAAIRESDLVARLGGDEFVVVLRLGEGQAVDYSAMVADKILSSVAQPYLVDGHPLGTTPSIGIALYPHDGDDMSTLMKCADIAMHQAKETGRRCFCFFAGAATPLRWRSVRHS